MEAVLIAALFAFWTGVLYGFILVKVPMVIGGIVATWTRGMMPHRRALVLFAVYVLCAIVSVAPRMSWAGRHSEWTLGVLSAAIYLLLTGYEPRSQYAWLKWAGVSLSVYALVQRFGYDPFIGLSDLPAGHRAVASMGSPVDLGAVLAMSATVAGGWLPVIAGGLWATGSRAAWVAAAFAITPGRWKWAYVALLFVPLMRPPQSKDIARVEVWKSAFAAWREHPVLGSGPDTFFLDFQRLYTPRYAEAMLHDGSQFQANAHNDLLQALATTGIVGLAAYLWFVWPLLDCAPLLALFLVLKFDPVSFEVLCCGALLAGSHLRRKGL